MFTGTLTYALVVTTITEVQDELMDWFDVDTAIRREYTGPDMGTDTCFGFTAGNGAFGYAFLHALRGKLDPEVLEGLRDTMRSDSLGRSTVIYFRGVTLVGEAFDVQ